MIEASFDKETKDFKMHIDEASNIEIMAEACSLCSYVLTDAIKASCPVNEVHKKEEVLKGMLEIIEKIAKRGLIY